MQERDPRSYQIFLQLPSGATFLGSTPEQLYMRSGQAVASEAVAATRPRGPAGRPPPPPPLAVTLSVSAAPCTLFTGLFAVLANLSAEYSGFARWSLVFFAQYRQVVISILCSV